MHENLALKLGTPNELGPGFTTLVVALFQQVVEADQLREVYTLAGGSPHKRKLSKPKGKFNLVQRKVAPKVHNQAIDLILGVTKLLTREGTCKLSKEVVECLVRVGRLSLLTLFTLEELIAPKTFSLDQLASNFVTQLIALKRFAEAELELQRILFRMQQHLEPHSAKAKRPRGPDKVNSGPGVERSKLYEIGFEFHGLLPVCQEKRQLYHLILTLQANLLKVYTETGDVEKLEVLGFGTHLTLGGPIAVMQSLAQLPGSNELGFCDMFCHYYANAFNLLVQRGRVGGSALGLQLLSLRSLNLSKQSTPASVLDVCFKMAGKLESAPIAAGALVKVYDEVFEIIPSGSAPAPLVACSALLHYLGLATSLCQSAAAFDKVSRIFEGLAQPFLAKEAILGRWVLAAGSVGVIFTSLNMVDEAFAVKVSHALADAKGGLGKLLERDGAASLLESLSQGLRAMNRTWAHREKFPPLSRETLTCLLESIALLLAWMQKDQFQPSSSKWTNLVALVCDFLLAVRKPLLNHNAKAFLEQLRVLGHHMLKLKFPRGQQVLSSIAASCGSIVGHRLDYVLSTEFFLLSVKLLECNANGDSLQLSSNYTNLAKVQRASGNLQLANQSLISAINHSPNVEVSPEMPPYTVVDTKHERLGLVQSYVHWNLANEYQALGLAGVQADGLALAAILEREIHHLQLRSSANNFHVRLNLVERLIEIYRPLVWYRLLHSRALLIKADVLIDKLIFNSPAGSEPVLREVLDSALKLLNQPGQASVQESLQLASVAYFLLGVIDREFKRDPTPHFTLAIDRLSLAYSGFAPPTDAEPKPGSSLAEDAFRFCRRFQGLLALLPDHALKATLCQVQLAICGARAAPDCIPDVVETYINQAQLIQAGGDNPGAEAALTRASKLIAVLSDKSPGKKSLFIQWKLCRAKFEMSKPCDKGKVESILGSLDERFANVKLVGGVYQILTLAYQVYAHSLLIQGKLDLAINSATQHHRLCFRTIHAALLNRGVPRTELSNLDNPALLAWFGRSPEHQLVADLLSCLNAFGQLYMHRGSPKDAEHMFKNGLHLAECARATGFECKFRVCLADLHCRRHLWIESRSLANTVITRTWPGLDANQGDILESRAAATACQGSVFMSQSQFKRALDQFDHAVWLLSHADELPIFSTDRDDRFRFWQLQSWLACMHVWAKSKANHLDEAGEFVKRLSNVPLPKLDGQIYNLLAAKVSIARALDLAKSDLRFSSLLDSVWSLPPASTFASPPRFKYMGSYLATAAKHLNLALEDALHFGFVKDVAEVCTNFGMLAFLMPRLNFQTEIIPTQGRPKWAASHLEIYKAISYRRELNGLLPIKLGLAPPPDAVWPKSRPSKLAEKSPYWSRVLQPSDPLKLIDDVLDLLPEKWAVCSLSFNPETEDLYVARFQGSLREPVVLRLPTCRQASVGSATSEDLSFTTAQAALKGIIDTSTEITRKGSECDTSEKKKAWWLKRAELDAQLEKLLAFIETAWLGGLKGVMAVDEATPGQVPLLKRSLTLLFKRYIPQLNKLEFDLNESVLNVALKACCMTREEIEDLMLFLLDSLDFSAPDAEVLDKLVEEAGQLWHNFFLQPQTDTCFEGSHLILILDKHTQPFPWECMPMLLGKSVSRLPSLPFLHNILIGQSQSRTSLFGNGHFVDEDKAFYVLNPDKDLMATQRTFQDGLIKYLPWEGTIANPPSPDQIEAALTTKDLYIYIGHGSGAKYIRGSRIKSLPRCSVALLLGCSSGALRPDGDFDPSGEVMSYLMAGSPTILANLWDVTDKDLDRFTLSLFDGWGLKAFSSQSDAAPSLTQAVAKSREACLLRYLVGAAPVVYGIPCYLKR